MVQGRQAEDPQPLREAHPARGRGRRSHTTALEQRVEELTNLVHTLAESVAHLVGRQLPNGHMGDDPIDPANPNNLPNEENQRVEAEGTKETGGDNKHPPPARPV
ncbi:hypothetical protein TIFTF001_034357 [Ficus carica]|uniref:Uncharacterized protein n=1 Tax=Ficus carica TaxID=3494 RepID=A0AA88DZL4_FICCA|nr:hypothetical protein TIFTF001_034357 [Ficus carica]